MYIRKLNISTTEVYGPFQGHTDISVVLDKIEEPDSFFTIIKELLRFGAANSTNCLEKNEVKFEKNSSVSYYSFSLREVDKTKVIKILTDVFTFILNHKITFPNSPDFGKWYMEHLAKITDFFTEALIVMKENKFDYYFQCLDGWN